MAIRPGGLTLREIYHGSNRNQAKAGYLGNRQIYAAHGVPTVSVSVSPDKLLESRRDDIHLHVVASNFTVWVLREIRADGVESTILHNTDTSVTDVTQRWSSPDQNATYTLTATNVNGSAHTRATFTRGSLPVITTWSWGAFRQTPVNGLLISSVELHWNVSGDPAPLIEIVPNIHFHPGYQASGAHRHTRVGTAPRETLTLRATNIFGSVSQSLTINWP